MSDQLHYWVTGKSGPEVGVEYGHQVSYNVILVANAVGYSSLNTEHTLSLIKNG